MVRCKNCKSINVKISSLNFAHKKEEGAPSAKAGKISKEYYCHSCSNAWLYDSKCEDLYNEYLKLKSETNLIAHTVKPGVPLIPQHIDINKLMRRTEIANNLVNNYQHILDIGPEEWFILSEDAR